MEIVNRLTDPYLITKIFKLYHESMYYDVMMDIVSAHEEWKRDHRSKYCEKCGELYDLHIIMKGHVSNALSICKCTCHRHHLDMLCRGIITFTSASFFKEKSKKYTYKNFPYTFNSFTLAWEKALFETNTIMVW